MKEIDYSISTAKSLFAMSVSMSEEDVTTEENSEVEDNSEEDNSIHGSDALSMSDEEFEKLTEEDFIDNVEDEEVGDDRSNDGDETVQDETSVGSNEEEPAEETSAEQEQLTESSEDQPNNGNMDQSGDAEQMQKEVYDLLFANPIKASGREVKLKSPAHALNFVEMGIDYNKKMQYMRPHMQTIKTLDKEGLLGDEEKFNLLIEASHGNPDAIKKLIVDSKIDPIDLADEDVIEQGKQYQPQNHIVSEREVEINEALNSIESSPAQGRTLEVMTKEFDHKSREIISENPDYIVALNADIESGIYDVVMENVQYKKDMRMAPPGISDMELYIMTVQEMANAERQNAPVQQEQQTANQNNQTNVDNGKRKRKKLGMSGNKTSKTPSKKQYDPSEVFNMSDEDFDKKFKELGLDII